MRVISVSGSNPTSDPASAANRESSLHLDDDDAEPCAHRGCDELDEWLAIVWRLCAHRLGRVFSRSTKSYNCTHGTETHACLQTGSSTLALPEQDGRFAVSLEEAAPVHLLRCIIMLTTLLFAAGSGAPLRTQAASVDWWVKNEPASAAVASAVVDTIEPRLIFSGYFLRHKSTIGIYTVCYHDPGGGAHLHGQQPEQSCSSVVQGPKGFQILSSSTYSIGAGFGVKCPNGAVSSPRCRP